MADILHGIRIQSDILNVYQALTTIKGLSGWWTTDTHGEGDKVGGILRFRFDEHGFFDIKVLELDPNRSVLWEVLKGHEEEWLGTKIKFELDREANKTTLLFKHQDWKTQGGCMHFCSTKWAVFLLSLKSLVETGKGNPYPG